MRAWAQMKRPQAASAVASARAYLKDTKDTRGREGAKWKVLAAAQIFAPRLSRFSLSNYATRLFIF